MPKLWSTLGFVGGLRVCMASTGTLVFCDPGYEAIQPASWKKVSAAMLPGFPQRIVLDLMSVLLLVIGDFSLTRPRFLIS